jgi:alanine racemase
MSGFARRVRLEIDLGTLRRNFERVSERVAPCGVIAVLKANAYGLGVGRIASTLVDAGVAGFAAAELSEALELLPFGCPVQILGAILPEEVAPAVAAGVDIPLPDLATARAVSATAQLQGVEAVCHVVVDTGMGRLGVVAGEVVGAVLEMSRLPGVRLRGIYSHFPMAYRSAEAFTVGQISTMVQILETLERAGVHFEMRHVANSDAINNFPAAHSAPFTHVRTGINLHGSFDLEGKRELDLASVLTLKARLAQVRTLPRGATIGYGLTYRLPREMRVGTVAAGYADGLPLALSNRGHLVVRGQPCQILGRVSMDYTTVALDQVPEAQAGDEVFCLGGGGLHEVTVEDWAALKGTHPYEVICGIGSRVERCCVGDLPDPDSGVE